MSPKKTARASKNQIYTTLRSEIILGHRKAGERLAINDLTARFGTSVTPVRDALQMLSQEGLITIKPRSGYFITQVTLKELRDMLELREILEVAAVERAAAAISAGELEALRKVHAGYTGDDDRAYTRYTDENMRFHYLLAQASGNQELALALRGLHERLARFMVIRKAGKHLEDIHRLLIDRLAANDVAGARKAIVEEVRNSRKAIMDRIMQEEAAHWHVGTGS
ncbi:GntR family transcriptional regulator [Desulfosarcina alkanivorans]|uniref:GntR family transcriptional regulator n=1 Tax=Desulfosarcina alkanivorans TaxID=571177 RepID=A0A5K7YN47_9BACT|nr:GntR family transcriptional regulator [Desulfosarcina alkanivorans]BBO70626.1 GntR family transcriptional regulator [Desulfosarcina alkanivorans]